MSLHQFVSEKTAYLPPMFIGILTETSNVFVHSFDDAFDMKALFTQSLKAHYPTIMRQKAMGFV